MALRSLPVYLVADCSGSMAGSAIESVKSGMRAAHAEMMGDPSTVEVAFISLITFNDSATQLIPLTDIAQFNFPDFQAGGRTNLGAALKLLIERMDIEVAKNSPEQKGDWKPLVFLFTDGAPTDTDWPKYASDLKAKRSCNMIALAAGEAGDSSVLKQITETVLVMKDMGPDSFKAFFKFVSQSVKQTSQKVGTTPGGSGITLPPPPPGITIVP
jgi:uncharacterized protein YegL